MYTKTLRITPAVRKIALALEKQLAADYKKHKEGEFSVDSIAKWRDFFDSRTLELRCFLIPWSDEISEKYGDYIPGTLCTRRNLPHFRFSSSVPGAPDELLELDMADDFVVVAGTGCAAGTLADLMCYFN